MAKTLFLSNPRKRRTKRKANPAKRKTVAKRTTAKRRRPTKASATAAARVLRRRRRNPAKRSIVDKTLLPAAKGAAGAVALDMAYNLLPIPADYQSGIVGNLIKAAAVIGMGMGLEKTKLIKGNTAHELVNGSLTVQFYGMAQELVGSTMAAVQAPAGAAADTGTVGYIATAMNAGSLPSGLGAIHQGSPASGLGMFDYEEQEQF